MISAFLQADLQLPTVTWSVEVPLGTVTDVTASKYLKVAAESKSHGMPRLTVQQIVRFISAHAVSIINARAFVVCTCSLHMFAFMFPRQKCMSCMSFVQFCSLHSLHSLHSLPVHLPQEDGAIVARAARDGVKPQVRLWQADSCDSHRMDFRFVSAKAEAEGT